MSKEVNFVLSRTAGLNHKPLRSEGQRPTVARSWMPALRFACLFLAAHLYLFSSPPVQLITHRRLVDDIFETVYSIKTGNGPYDRIQVHRVVREMRGRPLETDKALMLLHGDVWGFNGAFLGAGSPPASLPVFLARRGGDVWGIDLAWTLVPKETTDFGFMKTWDLQHDIDDAGRAIELAQQLRRGHSPMVLLGWSRGGWVGYGLLNQESQLPHARRRVSGFIAVDTFYKSNDPGARNYSCGGASYFDGQIAAGNYVNANTLEQFGVLAETNPAGISPFFPPATNYQASLMLGAVPFPSFTPHYHFVGGIFPQDDTSQIPTGLNYTDVPRFNAFLKAAGPYQAAPMLGDSFHVTCATGPSGRYDDHLGDIKVPVFYVGAAGGFGTAGLHTLTLLGSRDRESLIVRLRPRGQEGLEFAHLDLFYGRDAPFLVWSKIDRWLESHSGGYCDRND